MGYSNIDKQASTTATTSKKKQTEPHQDDDDDDDGSCTQTTERLSSSSSYSCGCGSLDLEERQQKQTPTPTPPPEHSSSQASTERLSSSSERSSSEDDDETDEAAAVATDQEKQTPTTSNDITSPSTNEESKEASERSSSSSGNGSSKNDGSNSSSSSKRRVSFKNIEIREYPRCLGENPSVTAGPPLSIGWRHNQSYVLDLDQYENYKDGTDLDDDNGGGEQNNSRRRRTSAEFQLPRNLREEILREECAHDDQSARDADVACTDEEIQRRCQEMQKARRQRQASYAMQEFETLEILWESCWRKLQKLKCCRSSRTGVSREEDSWVYDYTPQTQVHAGARHNTRSGKS